MREIKFRAWVPRIATKSKMIYDDFSVHCDGTGQWMGDDVYPFDVDDVVMQYTGLKDKNGVEIYEGDIVKIPEGNTDRSDYIEVVRYNQKLASFEIANNYYGLQEADIETNDVQVIGNIYENPELLGEADKLPQKSGKDVKDESGVLKNSPEVES